MSGPTTKRGPVGRLRTSPITTVALVVLLVGRLADLMIGPGPITLPDTPMYLRLPGEPLFAQVSFVGSTPRPWVVTLPYALIRSHLVITLLQRLAGVIAWSLLIVAIGRLRSIRDPFRWLLIGAVVAVALSPIVTIWDPLLQSDSFAMTGTVVLCAGILELFGRPVRLVRSSVLLLSGSLVSALIRPALLPLVVVAAFAVTLMILRDRERVGRRPVLQATAVSVALLVLCGYVFVVNDRTDYAWGSKLSGQDDLRGRTLQQVGVIGALPWGKNRMKQVARDVEAPCVERMFIDPPPGTAPVAWRAELLQHCPDDTRRFAEAVEQGYLRGLMANPRQAIVDLWPALTDAFGPTPPDPQSISIVPPSLGDLWTADPKKGSNPILLWGLALAVLLVVAARRRRLAEPLTIECCAVILAGVVAGAVGVGLTAAFSPLDTYRVASAPAMATRLLLLVGVALVAGRVWDSRSTRSQQSAPELSWRGAEAGKHC